MHPGAVCCHDNGKQALITDAHQSLCFDIPHTSLLQFFHFLTKDKVCYYTCNDTLALTLFFERSRTSFTTQGKMGLFLSLNPPASFNRILPPKPCHHCPEPAATPSNISRAPRQKRPTSSQRRRPCRRRPSRPIAQRPRRGRSAGAVSLPVTTYEHLHPPDAPQHHTPAPEAGSMPR
jgi:hypothetical protein